MNRNIEIEQRIKNRQANDLLYGINSYGGMGMDCCSPAEKKLKWEELNYIQQHPEIFKRNRPNCVNRCT